MTSNKMVELVHSRRWEKELNPFLLMKTSIKFPMMFQPKKFAKILNGVLTWVQN